MLISIIIPHRNDTCNLTRLINSIESFDDIEVIIIDDHSNVEEKDKLKQLAITIKKIQIYHNNTEIISAGRARNIGLTHARGQWIIFADSDDLFLQGWQNIIYEEINTDADIIHFKPTSYDYELNRISTRHLAYCKLIDKYLKKSSKDNEMRLRTKFYPAWSKIYSKKFIETNNIIFEEVVCSNDIMFTLRAGLLAKEIKVCDSSFYSVSSRIGSLTNQKTENDSIVRYKVFLRSQELLRESLSSHEYKICKSLKLRWVYRGLKNKHSLHFFWMVLKSLYNPKMET